MDGLKLTALDAQDLEILSAHTQDAIVRAGDMQFLPRQQKFILTASRFDWEHALESGGLKRRRSVMQFARVQSVKVKAIPQGEADVPLDLLSLSFEAGDAPSGVIILSFAGGGTIRLMVECIEAQLADLAAAWAAKSLPAHAKKG